MKILHVLAGYLAATALPIHSFAFASPLAAGMDYDGYVNTTAHSHLQVTTGSETIDARQLTVIIPAVALVIDIVATVIFTVVSIHQDENVRGSDVDFLVEYID